MPQMVLPESSRGHVYHPSNIKFADSFLLISESYVCLLGKRNPKLPKINSTPLTTIPEPWTLETKFSNKHIPNQQYTCFLKRAVFNKTKAPASQPRHRRPSSFLLKIRKYGFHQRQNDASDTFYPMGPPKPLFLIKLRWFYWKWAKDLIIIVNFFIIP